MSQLCIAAMRIEPAGELPSGGALNLHLDLQIDAHLLADLDGCLLLSAGDGQARFTRWLGQDGWDIAWLPRGHYRLSWHCSSFAVPAGDWRLKFVMYQKQGGQNLVLDQADIALKVLPGNGRVLDGHPPAHWSLVGAEGSPDVEKLAWRQGLGNWFHRHFDHAARVIASYMLGDSPLLRGRILDVGCGDGITDLGLLARCNPQSLVGIDPFRGFERLPQILKEQQIPQEVLADPRLRFEAADGNHLPFADDSFDVVVSWGSLEHIAGGHRQTLREIKRVLRDGGLFFLHPGLYYSNRGHHLWEFSREPFLHLTRSEEELRDLVLNTPMQYEDRAGEFSEPAQYWQWYLELNRITVSSIENELRVLDFDFWRAAVRAEDRIEYTAALQSYPILDLAVCELYLSCINRKATRPAAVGGPGDLSA